MIIYKPSLNWKESYQNPCKTRSELCCYDTQEAIPPADRTLFLELLLHLSRTEQCPGRTPAGAGG